MSAPFWVFIGSVGTVICAALVRLTVDLWAIARMDSRAAPDTVPSQFSVRVRGFEPHAGVTPTSELPGALPLGQPERLDDREHNGGWLGVSDTPNEAQ